MVSVPALRTRIWSNHPIIYMREIDAFPAGVEAKVSFVGLFDTVGSFYLAGNENNLDFNLHLSPSCADQVVHYTAYHEIRRNFPLTSIIGPAGEKPAHFKEVVMPGAHSDVGGGYENPEKDLRNFETFDLQVFSGHGLNWRTVQAAQRQIEAWNARDSRNIQPDVRGADVYAVERRPTRKELAVHVLHEMYTEALSAGVPLRVMNESEEEYRIPMDLEMALADWKASGSKLDQAKHYLREYIHTSHRTGSIAHAPIPSGKREVYPNRSSGSVSSTESVRNDSLATDQG